ncbi:FAD-linked sulfhydryl oxidase ALR [Ceratocystis lukuohia]|uniref:Sulfhydryl oxidase n=2 Tax=Ceratocystis TaxID=5157 RepID=A0A2C5X7A7_9PEZI|nr:FAD-linked sulfhydryl oxidase ALR [Ceratocystis fimbriata CBS 114723]
MAAERTPSNAQQQDVADAGSVASGAIAPVDVAPKQMPKGVVLGKDGKPCRSCTSFASWASQTKSSLKTAEKPNAETITPSIPSDCPPDVEALGRSSWTLLHSMAASYPEQPSPGEQSDMLSFVKLFSKLYPCWVCAEDFQAYLARDEPRVKSRSDFGQWLCGAHNEVNTKLGKPVFDCSKWEERWRTGWKNGRCN